MSQTIETETIELDGQTYRISIYPDDAPPNPLADWCEMGTILSLNRRHVNFAHDRIEAAIDDDSDAVALSYFEHGLCRWSVAGELTGLPRCPFDSVPFAGIWLPDDATRASASSYRGRTRRSFMRERARQACDAYTDWCNGEVYGFSIDRLLACVCCGEQRTKAVESCWGFYGLSVCLAEARAMLATLSNTA